MSENKPLKSAYELAMERLRKNDEAAGISQQPLTEAQKAAIGEVRNLYEAKLAEQKVLHDSGMRKTADPEERATLQERFRRDWERLSSERDRKIERIRSGESA
jgi:hypothetical protein